MPENSKISKYFVHRYVLILQSTVLLFHYSLASCPVLNAYKPNNNKNNINNTKIEVGSIPMLFWWWWGRCGVKKRGKQHSITSPTKRLLFLGSCFTVNRIIDEKLSLLRDEGKTI